MESLKDSLSNHSKTVTLTAPQIDFLMRMNAMFQQALNEVQEKIAAEYLRQLAVDNFKMSPSKDFHFDFHPEREFDNLVITEKADRK